MEIILYYLIAMLINFLLALQMYKEKSYKTSMFNMFAVGVCFSMLLKEIQALI